MIWNATFMEKIRSFWLSQILKLQIMTDAGACIDLQTVEQTIDGNALKFLVRIPAGDDFTISGIRIIDTDGNTAGVISDEISKMSDDEFYIVLRFSIYEL